MVYAQKSLIRGISTFYYVYIHIINVNKFSVYYCNFFILEELSSELLIGIHIMDTVAIN